SNAEEPNNVVKTAQELIAFASEISPALLQEVNTQRVGVWSFKQQGNETFVFTIPAGKLASLKGIQIGRLNGDGEATVSDLSIKVDGAVALNSVQTQTISTDQPVVVYPIDLSADIKANNSCELKVTLKGSDILGDIILLEHCIIRNE
ncbi:MAG: hypothetical protein ACRCR3_13860, partial [Tannerellaceae bacterium]